MKLSKTSVILHGIPHDCNLTKLKQELNNAEGRRVFVPANGLYWLRKGNKQLVQLKTDHDWQSCRDDYRDAKGNMSSVRIACVAVNCETSCKFYIY